MNKTTNKVMTCNQNLKKVKFHMCSYYDIVSLSSMMTVS
jgi:hypothetical protein